MLADSITGSRRAAHRDTITPPADAVPLGCLLLIHRENSAHHTRGESAFFFDNFRTNYVRLIGDSQYVSLHMGGAPCNVASTRRDQKGVVSSFLATDVSKNRFVICVLKAVWFLPSMRL